MKEVMKIILLVIQKIIISQNNIYLTLKIY